MISRINQRASTRPSAGRPCLLSFSGIDGAGKSTQIDALLAWLRDAGHRVRVLRLWDDIAVLGYLRETASYTLFKSERGVGSAGKPVQRRDKNVRAWYMTIARLALYFLDAMRLALVVATTSRREVDVVVFDRYLHDELANLALANPLARFYARLLLRLVPHSDCAFLLDADPVQARARKPEYPIDFLHSIRASYLDLAALDGDMTIIPPLCAEDVTRSILRHVASVVPPPHSSRLHSFGRMPDPDWRLRSHQ